MVLFPLAYESQEFLLVELATSTTPGGALFRWGYDGGPAQPVFPDLETAFACAAEGWRRGVLSTWESPTQDAWTRLSATYSQAADYPEHLAPFEAIDLARPLSWPRVWQEASGIDPALAEPRGSTTTIQALREGRRERDDRRQDRRPFRNRSRIACRRRRRHRRARRVVSLRDQSVRGRRLRPTRRAGRRGHVRRREASSREFDALAAGISTSAIAGDLAAAQAYALELGSFLDPAAADALATAARPLGEATRWGQTKLRDGYDAP